jgi:putative transposase
MPSRNEIKEALPDADYHVYNRGVEYRDIFMDGRDYQRFMLQMRQYLLLEPTVSLLAFSLMPNHFHMMLHQSDQLGVSRFLQRLITGYVMYFNHKYRRIGPLFQGKYKASRIVGAEHLMEVSRYIHLNPERAGLGWQQHAYSSLAWYIEPYKQDSLVDARPVLELFDLPGDYRAYLRLAPTSSDKHFPLMLPRL